MKNIGIWLLVFTCNMFSQDPCKESPTVNYGGKIYNTVKIGDQCWLKENLDIGTMIIGNKLPSNNLTIEKYYYNNDSINNKIYGAFYLWKEAMQYKSSESYRGICPEGWHIPSKEELDKLCDYVQNNSNALKINGVGTGLGLGTNSSGFSSFLSGYKGNDNYFYYQNSFVRYWTSTSSDTNNAYTILLYNNNSNIGKGTGDKEFGYCVRCIKDNLTSVSDNLEQPIEFTLFQNVPNPFNPETLISYTIPQNVASSNSLGAHVTLKVYDFLGGEIATLVNQTQHAGKYQVHFDGSRLASGTYIYTLKTNKQSQTKKMLLVK